MSLSANRKDSGLPAPLQNQSGFGKGFRFHYEQKTQQSDWRRQHYHGFDDSKNDGQNIDEDLVHTLPQLVPPAARQDEIPLDPCDRLAFATEVSIRYHRRRHTHYDAAFRLMMLSVVLLTAFAFMGGVSSRAVLGLSIIGLAAGSVLWNITGLSRLHDVLCSEYQHLLELIRLTQAPQAQDIHHWRNVRLRIQSKEPPVYWAVANDCYYDVARAWHLAPKRREKLPMLLRPFMNWVRF